MGDSIISKIPIIGGAVDAATGIYNAATQGAQNRKQRAFQREMYAWQRQDALADWQMENEYNSPLKQMERLRSAGLNPNLVYGNGADAQSSANVRQSTPSGNAGQAPELHMSPLAAYQNLNMGMQQQKNLEQQLELMELQKAQIAANTVKTAQETTNLAQRNKIQQPYEGISAEIAKYTLEGLKSNVAKTQADTQFTLDSNERAAISNSQSIKESAERILTLRAQRQWIAPSEKQQIEESKARIANMEREGKLKDLDIKLREKGINPSDPIYWRMLAQLLSGKAVEDLIRSVGTGSKEQAGSSLNNVILNWTVPGFGKK